jgi:hypothetical protein
MKRSWQIGHGPDAGTIISARGDQNLSVAIKQDRTYIIPMSVKIAHHRTRVNVPNTDCVKQSACCESFPLGIECER